MGRRKYTLPRDKLLKREFNDIRKPYKLNDRAGSQAIAAEVVTKYLIELNKTTPISD